MYKKWKIQFAPTFWNSFEKCFSNKLRYLIPRKIGECKHNVKYAWQRVFRGYDDVTVWNLHGELAKYLPKILRKLKKEHLGHPADLENVKSQEDGVKKWEAILEKMAKGFEAAEKISNSDYMKEVKLKKPKKDIFGKMSYTTYRYDKREYNRLYKQFEEGMALFKDYYFNLWD